MRYRINVLLILTSLAAAFATIAATPTVTQVTVSLSDGTTRPVTNPVAVAAVESAISIDQAAQPSTLPSIPPATQPAQLIRGVQGAWIYSGNYAAGCAFPAANNPARLQVEQRQNLTAVRIWATIPNGCIVGAAGDNQAPTMALIRQAYSEHLTIVVCWTPNQNQGYKTPFLPTEALTAWEGQWLDSAEATTGVKSAVLFPLGIELGNEVCNFTLDWAGKQAEIPAFVQTSASLLHARGVLAISPAWNGTSGVSNLSALQAAYAPFLASVDAISLHPYSTTPGQWSALVYAWAQKPIVMTEFNSVTVNTGDPRGDATKLKAAMTDLQANGAHVIAIMHWPSVSTPSIPGGSNGLVTQTGTINDPQYNAFLSN